MTGIVSDTGTATTKFTIRAAPAAEDNTQPLQTVQTGDSSNIALWIVLLLISGGDGLYRHPPLFIIIADDRIIKIPFSH